MNKQYDRRLQAAQELLSYLKFEFKSEVVNILNDVWLIYINFKISRKDGASF